MAGPSELAIDYIDGHLLEVQETVEEIDGHRRSADGTRAADPGT